ncbi:MAG: hypothetical protein DRG78_01225 [Epsilonproteobacteria bacterium]|nr:MAG: hypothetical protein DRG78_01225 [Campylobacterota bacterium]
MPKNKKTKKSLNSLAQTRTGGEINIKGLNFQFLYACYTILDEHSIENKEYEIHLEGVEDLDIRHKNEFVQLKSSINQIDAHFFWSKNVLKNFLEVSLIDEDSKFKFVHNSNISNGNLKAIEKGNLTTAVLKYWEDKIKNPNINTKDFLEKISFEKYDEKILLKNCKRLLIEKFKLNNNTEEQFLLSLRHHIFIWSKDSKKVTFNDVNNVVQMVKDSFSKTPTNEAINKNLIIKISFKINTTVKVDNSYFDGKSAKPIDIINKLPVVRKNWINNIKESLLEFDVTVLKSSSGQGKSTLAWQVSSYLEEEKFTIYELLYCDSIDSVEELYDFLNTRVSIGELPVIVIDGLNQVVSKYDILINRLSELPVKIIITTREEDWYKYSFDTSKIKLKIIDIKLLKEEAKDIYNQLKINNKIYKNIKNWQSVWEQVEQKGLLIEYVYLLTHGSMIKDRLQYQIKQLNQDEDSRVKIEILRLIALADILNIKIQTRLLTSYIENNIDFKSDRGELYNLLEKEYFIRFDKKYVEGLHPVRSEHLSKILHKNIVIEETAIALLQIIDNKFIYDYFIAIPFLIDSDKEYFFEESSKIIAQKSFTEMVPSIDGLMHYEAYKFWVDNKEIFDNTYDEGYINLFVMDTLPFTKLETIKKFNDIAETIGMQFLIEQLDKLSLYNVDNSYIHIFTNLLAKELSKSINKISNYENFGFLMKWFIQLDITLEKNINLDEDLLLQITEKKDLKESSALYNYFYISQNKAYNEFIEKHKKHIFSILKKKTDSLIIYDKDNELYIKYLIDHSQSDKLNECSMERIDTIYDFFPDYKRYNTESLYLPFPAEEIYKELVLNSIKHIPNENLYHKFDVHINQIWIKTIMQKYAYSSIYEWQEKHFKIRKNYLEYTKKLNKLFELLITEKLKRNKADEVDLLYSEIIVQLKKTKEFPYSSSRYNENKTFEKEIGLINGFISSFRNFLTQMVKATLLQDKNSQESNLVIYNLKEAFNSLENMQKSFDLIQENTTKYFDVNEIKKEEKYWIERLLNTIDFYQHSSNAQIMHIKDDIYNYSLDKQRVELETVHKVLQEFGNIYNRKVIYPLKITEENNLREITIGIDTFDEDEIDGLIEALVDFYKNAELSFINILNVDNERALYGFRVPISYFIKIKNTLDGNEFEDCEFGNPHPIIISDKLLNTLDGNITLDIQDTNNNLETSIEMMFDIWRLTEYQEKLDTSAVFEREYLSEIENKYKTKINQNLLKIKDDNQFKDVERFVIESFDKRTVFSKSDIVDFMNNLIERYKLLN